ncbi:hypothetical protein C0Q70_08417 [Pomacea canaliculata]|uniref:Uncharacterized protein n=1 Tax=Pomacea canaliculata TaxID=400727 RepID=A0A2T7PHS3_POMCA|nr:hypothetical protein C0Q70_08417 [Pomacea canaliculata]
MFMTEGEEPARLQKRGVPSNTIFRPPPPVIQSPQPKRTHENSRVFPQPGDTNVFVHVEQPPRPGHPPPRPGQQPPRPGQQPHRPGQGPWAGNSKTHAPGAPKGNKPNTQGTGRGCSCREKSCPSHPCKQGGVLELLVQAAKFKRLPNHPMRNRLAQPMKGRLKRGSFIHQARILERKHQDILEHDPREIPLCRTNPAWNETAFPLIHCSIPGVGKKDSQDGAVKKSCTMEYIHKISGLTCSLTGQLNKP